MNGLGCLASSVEGNHVGSAAQGVCCEICLACSVVECTGNQQKPFNLFLLSYVYYIVVGTGQKGWEE